MTQQSAMDVVVMDDKTINVWGVPEVTVWSRSPLLELLRASEFPERTEKALRASAADAADRCAPQLFGVGADPVDHPRRGPVDS
jgi:hypothetical protein